MNKNICVTTVVFGEKYQGYIPTLLFSLLKSYPEYMPIIFVYGSLREDVRNKIKKIESLGEFLVIDNYFNQFNNLNAFQGKSLRWILRDELIMEYEYVYFVDIDMIYLREDPMLHTQHILHMDTTKVPFSNVLREGLYNNRKLRLFLHRLKIYGIRNAIRKFIEGTVAEPKLTGLHFVKTKEYFPAVNLSQIRHEKMLKSREYLRYYQGYSNETVLYNICKEAGFNFNFLGEYSDSNSLDFKNYYNPNFRPHHGLHLGIFREKKQIKTINNKVADSNTYKFYVDGFKELLKDTIFINLIENADVFIQRHFQMLFSYYGLKCK